MNTTVVSVPLTPERVAELKNLAETMAPYIFGALDRDQHRTMVLEVQTTFGDPTWTLGGPAPEFGMWCRLTGEVMESEEALIAALVANAEIGHACAYCGEQITAANHRQASIFDEFAPHPRGFSFRSGCVACIAERARELAEYRLQQGDTEDIEAAADVLASCLGMHVISGDEYKSLLRDREEGRDAKRTLANLTKDITIFHEVATREYVLEDWDKQQIAEGRDTEEQRRYRHAARTGKWFIGEIERLFGIVPKTESKAA